MSLEVGAAEAGIPRRRRQRIRTTRKVDRRRRLIIGLGCLSVTLLGSGLAFGAQQLPVLLVAVGCAVGAAYFLGQELTRLPRAAWVMIALAGYTVFQALPLPRAVVGVLSPHSARIWEDVLKPFGEATPAFATLSLDPAATAIEAMKWFAYACVVIAAAGARAARSISLISALLFACSLAVALVTFVHGLFDVQRIYGMYTPPDLADRWTRGPFVNGNNLAGYLNVGLFAGAGLWASERTRLPRWLPPLGVSMLVAGVVLSGSRGGVIALALGALLFVGVVLVQRRGTASRILSAVFVVAGIGLTSLALLGTSRLWQSLGELSIHGKTVVWSWSLAALRDFPVFGFGRGAFESAFWPYVGRFGDPRARVYTHAENFVVDWAVEWGVAVTLAALVAFAFIARRAPRRAGGDALYGGVWIGLLVLLIQNLVDFGLEIFGIAALAAVAVSTLESREDHAAVLGGKLPRAAFVPMAGTLLAAVAVLVVGAEPLRAERKYFARAVAELSPRDRPRVAALRSELRAAMLRHPAEPFFPLLGAHLVQRTGGQNHLVWLGHALERGPNYGAVHLALADSLRARGHTGQAMIHLRLAVHNDTGLTDRALTRAAAWAQDVPALARAFPEGSEGAGLFAEVCERVSDGRRIDCWREAVRRKPDESSLDHLSDSLLGALESGNAPCTAAGAARCQAELERALDALAKRTRGFGIHAYRARLLSLRGEPKRATEILLTSCPAATEAAECVERAVTLAAKARDLELLERATERYLSLYCSAPPRCAAAHAYAGDKYRELDAWGKALKHMNAAAREDPTAARWLAVAEVAVRLKATASAHAALRRATMLDDSTADVRRRTAELEEMLQRAPAEP